MAESRSRGVRLSDLDRSKVYRLAYVGRRWEVVGEWGAPDVDAGACECASASGGAASIAGSYVPRHAAAPGSAVAHSETSFARGSMPAERVPVAACSWGLE